MRTNRACAWALFTALAGGAALPATAGDGLPDGDLVVATASTVEAARAAAAEPARLPAEMAAKVLPAGESLQWRPARRSAAEESAPVESSSQAARLVNHESPRPASRLTRTAPILIGAAPAALAQVDPFDDPFADPFGDAAPLPGQPVEEVEEIEQPAEPADEPGLPLPTPTDSPEELLPPRFDNGLPENGLPENGLPADREPRPIPDFGRPNGLPLPNGLIPEAVPREQPRRPDTLEEECRRAVEDLRNRRLADIDISIAIDGVAGRDFPHPCELDEEHHVGRHWAGTHFAWTASGLCHKPLYFEEVALERYGHTTGPISQPLLSAAHFFLSAPIVPYKMGLRTPNECVYALGHYRPGECAPYFIPPIPISARGAVFQAGAVVGVTALFP